MDISVGIKEWYEQATPAQKEAALNCRSAEALLQFAKGEGISLSEEDATKVFAAVNVQIGELSDEELEHVAGGKGSEYFDLIVRILF